MRPIVASMLLGPAVGFVGNDDDATVARYAVGSLLGLETLDGISTDRGIRIEGERRGNPKLAIRPAGQHVVALAPTVDVTPPEVIDIRDILASQGPLHEAPEDAGANAVDERFGLAKHRPPLSVRHRPQALVGGAENADRRSCLGV